jgi:ArsR family transcriptional regulator
LLGDWGQLLVTDFAMHDFDNYHENYAHRRLGFNDQDMRQFLFDNGFEMKQIRTLPASDPTTPDVKIWHAVKTSNALLATG